ncbi:MAG: 16S rRNA (uracil(1498)-N(3))-methyltransferase [Actinomycetes bacterium]
MSEPLFLFDHLGAPGVGDTVTLAGEEGRHAVVVRRMRPGERVVLSDGRGHGLAGTVSRVTKASLDLVVEEIRHAPEPVLRYVVVQALAKGDRAELACEMLTEVGVAEIVPWQASRSVVRWPPDRQAKARARWQATVREAAKQSRRLRIPAVGPLTRTDEVSARLQQADLALVLHEEATDPLGSLALPSAGEVLIVVGPEGGISPEELAAFGAVGARPVSLGAGVLRTSTAGVAALAALTLR